MSKIKTGSKAWMKSLYDTVLMYCPPIVECEKCGYVIHADYVCHCGHDGKNVEVDPNDWIFCPED